MSNGEVEMKDIYRIIVILPLIASCAASNESDAGETRYFYQSFGGLPWEFVEDDRLDGMVNAYVGVDITYDFDECETETVWCLRSDGMIIILPKDYDAGTIQSATIDDISFRFEYFINYRSGKEYIGVLAYGDEFVIYRLLFERYCGLVYF